MTEFCVADLLAVLDRMAAFADAESWDNVGLMVGDPNRAVTGILLSLDASRTVLGEAEERGCDVIVSHHPVIFHPLKSLRADDPVGALLADAVRRNIAIISCHTNLDVVEHGVSGALAKALGIKDSHILETRKSDERAVGFGSIGQLPAAMPGEQFIRHLMNVLSLTTIKVAGPVPEKINSVAVCGGSGSELTDLALAKGADIFVTGEVKHSVALWAHAKNFCVVDAGHYASEQVVVPVLARELADRLLSEGEKVPVLESGVYADPFSYFLKKDDGVVELC